MTPSVSIIIPARNEEFFIGRCLDSLVDSDYPKDQLEILVIDGQSEDGTKKVVEKYSQRDLRIRILNNPKKIAASGLNIGIKEAKGEVIVRIDSHTSCNKDYISKCVSHLLEYNPDNVGGIWEFVPQKNTPLGRAIVQVLASRLGSGNALYKIGADTLREVDTVPFGCFKKKLFEKIGYFNENLKRSQDMEFNVRIKKSGGKCLLIPEVVGRYYARSTLQGFSEHNFQDGIWAIYPLRFVKTSFRLRHYLPLIFVVFLLAVLFLSFPFFLVSSTLYFGIVTVYSFLIFLKEKDFSSFLWLPIVFLIRHFSYGIGSLIGAVKVLLRI